MDDEYGHCRVPGVFETKNGFKLGGWVSHRRREYQAGKLSQERIHALDALGFAWNPKIGRPFLEDGN